MNRSPTVANGDQNGIHHQRRAQQTYDSVHKNYKNNNLTQFYFNTVHFDR